LDAEPVVMVAPDPRRVIRCEAVPLAASSSPSSVYVPFASTIVSPAFAALTAALRPDAVDTVFVAAPAGEARASDAHASMRATSSAGRRTRADRTKAVAPSLEHFS